MFNLASERPTALMIFKMWKLFGIRYVDAEDFMFQMCYGLFLSTAR